MQVYVGRRCNLRGVRKQTDRQTDKQLARIWTTNMENVRAYMEILPNESSPGKRDAKRTEFLPMAKKIKQKKSKRSKSVDVHRQNVRKASVLFCWQSAIGKSLDFVKR